MLQMVQELLAMSHPEGNSRLSTKVVHVPWKELMRVVWDNGSSDPHPMSVRFFDTYEQLTRPVGTRIQLSQF